MLRRIILFTIISFITTNVWSAEGLVAVKSAHDVKTTMDRFEQIAKEKGVAVVARIDHQKNAKDAAIELRPTELIIFGNPKLGSHFFTSQQTAAIDLPLKAIAWEDHTGQVWLAYNDPDFLAKRHGIQDRDEIVKKMSGALQKFTEFATKP